MKTLKELIAEEAIAKRVAEIAKTINRQFEGKELIIVAVLKGSVCFLADLMRELTIPFQIEFVKAESYGMRGSKPGELVCKGLEDLDIKGKHVLLLDDIYDTGKTLQFIKGEFLKQHPKSIHTIVLLRKKRKDTPRPDFICFDIEDHFVVGYGLDYKEHHRGLKGIYTKTT